MPNHISIVFPTHLRNGNFFGERVVVDVKFFFQVFVTLSLVFVVISTNPSEQSFRNLIRAQENSLLKEIIKFLRIAFEKYCYQNYIFFSIASYDNTIYLGIFTTWFECSSFCKTMHEVDIARLIWVLVFIVQVAWLQGPFHVFMSKNFAASMFNIMQGRVWCVLFSCFSHNSAVHCISNSLSYWTVTPLIMKRLGKWDFFRLYILGGCFSASTSTLLTARKNDVLALVSHSYGVNGAVNALYGFLFAWNFSTPLKIKTSYFGGLELSVTQLVLSHILTDIIAAKLETLLGSIAGFLFGVVFFHLSGCC